MATTSEQQSSLQQQPVRTALVTGSSSGIGEAIVKRLAKLNYRLIVTGRNAAEVKRVAEECAKLSPSNEKPLEVVANLSNEAEVDRLFEQTIDHFQGNLDLLVNNAGLGEPVEHTQIEECYAAFKRLQQANLNAPVRLTLLAAPYLKKTAQLRKETSSVVNISSIAGFRPGQALFAYSTGKAALNMFSDSIAAEMAPLVRVNVVAPGPIETKIIERSGFSLDTFRRASEQTTVLHRIGLPDEVAQAVLFFADHKQSAFITGAKLVIDGGTSIAPLTWSP